MTYTYNIATERTLAGEYSPYGFARYIFKPFDTDNIHNLFNCIRQFVLGMLFGIDTMTFEADNASFFQCKFKNEFQTLAPTVRLMQGITLNQSILRIHTIIQQKDGVRIVFPLVAGIIQMMCIAVGRLYLTSDEKVVPFFSIFRIRPVV